MIRFSVRKSLLGALLLLLVLAFLSLFLGYSHLRVEQVLEALLGQAKPSISMIVWNIRLPRLLVSCLAGAALATSASLLQTLTHNPMADPGILGINAGASLAALASLFLPFSGLGLQSIFAWLGGSLAALTVYLLSQTRKGNFQSNQLLLVGMGLAGLLTSLTLSLTQVISPYQMENTQAWLSGAYLGDKWSSLMILAPLILISLLVVFLRIPKLNVLQLGPEIATGLGVNVQESRIILLLAAGLASFATLLVGNTAFVGFLASHLAKRLIGRNHSYSLPLAICLAASLMLLADTIGRLLLVGTGIPTGIILAIIGAPYCFVLMQKETS
ncbi:TPA: iron ABC transporter permease [Streptococcus suis]|nr:iron ABC transporter permease [Streptococcus suis]